MTEWFRKLFGPYGPETRKVQLTFFLGSWAALAAVGFLMPDKVLSENDGTANPGFIAPCCS